MFDEEQEQVAVKIANRFVDKMKNAGSGTIVLVAIKMAERAFQEGKNVVPGVRIGCAMYMLHTILDHRGFPDECRICNAFEAVLWKADKLNKRESSDEN